MLRARTGRWGAAWSEKDVEVEVRRYGVVKLSRRPLESPKGLRVWDTAVQGGEMGGGGGAEGGGVVVDVDLGAAGLVVVAAWMLMPAKCGLLCRESSTILQRELNSSLLNKNNRSLSAAHAFFFFFLLSFRPPPACNP